MYLPLSILAYFLNGIAVTIDKFLLTKIIPDPLVYVFYFSLISFVVLFAIPFVHIPSNQVLFFSSVSTLSWTLGAYLMFWALKTGPVQRVVPVIGALIPLILLAVSFPIGGINLIQAGAVILLVSGLIFLTIEDLKGRLILKETAIEVLSALFFALSYLLLREAFLRENFLTVLIWSRPILLPLGGAILLIPTTRKRVLSIIKQAGTSNRESLLFAGGQAAAGLSEVVLLFAISLESPALVNSLQGTKYIFLLIFSLVLGKKYPGIFKRQESGWELLTTILGIILIGIGLAILSKQLVPSL